MYVSCQRLPRTVVWTLFAYVVSTDYVWQWTVIWHVRCCIAYVLWPAYTTTVRRVYTTSCMSFPLRVTAQRCVRVAHTRVLRDVQRHTTYGVRVPTISDIADSVMLPVRLYDCIALCVIWLICCDRTRYCVWTWSLRDLRLIDDVDCVTCGCA